MIAPYTDEWYKARLGKVTASRANIVMAKGRGKDNEYGKQFYEYAKELAVQKLFGIEYDQVETYAMQQGLELEPQVRDWYANEYSVKVTEPGFITHKNPYYNEIGCTPDGLVEGVILLEIKCPQVKAHTDYLLNGIPDPYYFQIQFQLMVMDKRLADFVSFNMELPEPYNVYVERVHRNDTACDILLSRSKQLLNERDKIIEEFRSTHKLTKPNKSKPGFAQ